MRHICVTWYTIVTLTCKILLITDPMRDHDWTFHSFRMISIASHMRDMVYHCDSYLLNSSLSRPDERSSQDISFISIDK